MKKVVETIFVCSSCGNEYSKWSGQCSACGEWNSLKEISARGGLKRGGNKGQPRGIARTEIKVKNLGKMAEGISGKNDYVFSSQIGEFDRVLGKGIVRGGVVLFAGEPGIGKSTLLTQLIGKTGGLYVAGEESAEQIWLRVKRLGLDANKFDILGTNSVEEIIEFWERTNNVYDLMVVDSIQVMYSEEVTGMMGSPSQIRESAFRLIELAKKKGVAVIIVGHVTKEGDIAGPKLLEHMVDTVLYFEGEKMSDLRILRSQKNRFGTTEEIGGFRMEEKGLIEVKSEDIDLVGKQGNKVGSAVTLVMDGGRPILTEIQALVVESFGPMPKRNFVGIDYNRGQMLLAIAQKYLNIPLYKYDVFVTAAGGIRVTETAADVAVIGAIYSSYKNKALCTSLGKAPAVAGRAKEGGIKSGEKNGEGGSGEKLMKLGGNGIPPVLVGEVSLLGEVREAKQMNKRKRESERMGRRLVEIERIGELKNLVG